MHSLEIIQHLNKRATQRCADCGTSRIVLEGRGSFLASYEVDGANVLLCREDRGARAEAAYRKARRENETEV